MSARPLSPLEPARPAPSARRGPVSFDRAVVLVLGLTLLGALVRFWGLGRQGLWYDEADTALLMRYSAGHMVGLLPHSESTPPLYYGALWVWSRVVGQNSAALRSLSALAGVAVVPIAYEAAATLVSRRAGLICAALAACNPLLVWYAQEARAYSLLVALSGLSLLAAARAWRSPSPAALALWVVSSGLALATHYFAGLLIGPEVVWLALAHPRRRAVWAAVGAVGACVAALAPYALAQNGTGNDSWIAHEPLGGRLAQIVPQALLGPGTVAREPLTVAGIVLALVALGLLGRAARATRRGALLALALALTGLVLGLLVAALGYDELITRNLLALWLPAAVAVSGGLAAVGVPRLGPALAAGLCAIGLAGAGSVAAVPRLQRPDWPAVAHLLHDAPPAGQGRAILIQRFRTRLPLSLYLHGLVPLHGAARISQLDVVAMRSPHEADCWWGAECNLASSRLQPRYAVAGLDADGGRDAAPVTRVRQFRIMRLNAAHSILLTPAMVARSLHATRLRGDVLLVQRAARSPRSRRT